VNNEARFFINPRIGVNWKINDNNIIATSYSYNISNLKVLDIFSDFSLTGYRSFSKGTGTFNQLDVSSLLFTYKLGNWGKRFFMDTSILYTKNHDFLSSNTNISQNFTESEKLIIKDRDFLSINSKFNYYFKKISSNLKIDLGYNESEFKNIVNNSGLRLVKTTSYYYGLEARSGFKGVFNYHVGTKWTTNMTETTTSNKFTNNLSFLDLSLVFNEKFDFEMKSERYFFGNLQNDNTYYFLDFDVRYRLKKDKITFGVTGKNLFNTGSFKNYSVSDIGTSTIEYRLLPRFILFKIDYRF
jgi:hypothetical protein